MGAQLVALAAAVTCVFAGIGMVLPVLPLFLKHSLHVDDAAIGLVMGLHAGVAVLGRPAAGWIITTRGAQRVLVLGGVLVAAGSLLYTIATGLTLVITSRLIIGTGDACAMIAGAAWAITLAPSSQRGRVLGLFGLASWMGLTIGPALGAAASARFGMTAVWIGAAMLAVVGSAITAAGTPPQHHTPAEASRFSLIPRQVLTPGASLALSSAGYAMLPAFIVLLLAGRGSAAGAAVLTVTGIAFIVTRVALSSRIDRWDPRSVATVGALVEAFGLMLVVVSERVALPVVGVFVGGAIAGAGTSVLYPSLALIALKNVANSEAANALGAFTACWDAGLAGGAAIIGLLSARGGYDLGCAGAATLAVLSAVLTTCAGRRVPRSTRLGCALDATDGLEKTCHGDHASAH